MSNDSVPLLVTADDSTGATEAGAACADAGWIVDVVPIGVTLHAVGPSSTRRSSTGPSSTRPSCNCTVIDLRSRHLPAHEARWRMKVVAGDGHRVHKIDSTLRGNWAAELSALVDSGKRIVLIPSHPKFGRVCDGGVVYVDGVPVADTELANDPRLPVRSSRPSESVLGDELRGPETLKGWLTASGREVAIVDAVTLADIDRLVAIAVSETDVVLAGPASVVEAVARVCAPIGASGTLPVPLLPGPVVVVCASLHSMSRAQIANVSEAGVDVVTSSEVRAGDPDRVAGEVADRAHDLVAARQARSVILVGGDTAEAFIGDNVVRVFGSIDAGVSLGDAEIRGRNLRVASKPGGFGTANTLLDLVTR